MSSRIDDEQLTSISYRKRAVIGAVSGLVGGFAVTVTSTQQGNSKTK